MARAKKKKDSVKVNFKGVESRQTPPEGDYKCEVLEVASKESGKGNDMLEFTCEISEGKYKGTKLWFYATLDEKSLWKLHAFLTALGEEVPDDEMDIDLTELVGSEFVGVLTHETYQGKKRAKLTDFDTIDNWEGGAEDEDDEDDDDDKKSSKKSKGKKAGKGKSKSSDDDDDEDEDDEPKKKGKKSKSKKSDDDEDEDDEPKSKKGKKSKSKDEDDDDDDEPKGKKSKGKSSKKKAKKIAADDVDDMDEDELQDLIDTHDLDVDLDDYSKLKKKVAAVKEALEDADLLEDDD